MKSLSAYAVKLTGTAALAALLTTSAFADSRHQDQTYRASNDRRQSETNRGYRENDRVTMQGHISSFSHERNGYRVQLDRGNESYWVPDSYVRNRTRDLRVGVSINLGGVFRGGSVYVDAVSWPDGGGYTDSYRNNSLRGTVDRVDSRRSTVWVRDDSSRRIVEVDMRAERRGRLNIGDLRRGDRVELTGDWTRSGLFVATRIEDIRNGRY
ncbi:MAG TPA: hypothetical protein VGR02_01120 [Thermoanaerobaculia bacterium]|jgi:hypothetical protein|nr:hypothetical protein [Thermoanaerobaculia bacterium]